MKEIKEQEALSLLERLISVDTQNPPGNEDVLARWVGDYLAKAGCQVEIQSVAEGRSNMIAVLKGETEEKALLLCGHLDTVPFGDQNQWETEPNKPTIKDGRMYGRGTSDMKGGVAAMVYALAELAREDDRPKRDIIFLGTCDEESGGIGADAFCHHSLWQNVGEVLIAEPTGNRVSIASKGTLWLEVEVRGKAAHGSQPAEGINAISKAVEFSGRVRELLRGDEHPYLGASTCSLTGLRGGTKVNIIPEQCTMTLDIRTLPSVNHPLLLEQIETMKGAMEENCLGLRMQINRLNNRPSVEINQQDSFVEEISLAVEMQTGKTPAITASNFFSDASIFCQYRNLPVVLFGPGDPEEAHKANESMSMENYRTSVNCYTQILHNKSDREG